MRTESGGIWEGQQGNNLVSIEQLTSNDGRGRRHLGWNRFHTCAGGER